MKHTVLTSDGMERNIEKSIPIVFRTMRKKLYIKYIIYTYDKYYMYQVRQTSNRWALLIWRRSRNRFSGHSILLYTLKVYGNSRKEKRLARIYDVHAVRTRNVRKFGGVGKN